MTPTLIAAYLTLFVAAAALFVAASLLLGRFVRPRAPSPPKLEPYECGELPVGSAFVQFDLRFYVVALVFIIFEVEVALFFPLAVVFGQAIQAMRAGAPLPAFGQASGELGELAPLDAQRLAQAVLVELGVFFAVLLTGFAYVWRRGDLDWVRAVATDPGFPDGTESPPIGRSSAAVRPKVERGDHAATR